MRKFLFWGIYLFFLASCSSSLNHVQVDEFQPIDADSLVRNLESYLGEKVLIEGDVIHLCGERKHKAKLKTDDGAVIKLVFSDSILKFNPVINKKRVEVKGILSESRISADYLDEVENDGLILCHIDHKPCIDQAWIDSKVKAGVDDEISIQGIEKLRAEMQRTQKDYVSVPVVSILGIRIIK